MANSSQFLTTLENHSEPLISLKDLILQISELTAKQPNQIADKLESLLFDFRQNGKYTNAFCYCTIIDKNGIGREIYDPMDNNFSDAFDRIKSYLADVIFSNNANSESLANIFVRRSEIAKQIRLRNMALLDKAQVMNKPIISQDKNDYISIYDFVEWAKAKYPNYNATANDLIRLLNGANIQLYRQYSGIKESIDKDKTSLISALRFVAKHNGYIDPIDEIPF